MTAPPFLSEGVRQDVMQQGWARDPATGRLVSLAGWTAPDGTDPRLLAALRDGYVYDPATEKLTP